MIFTGSRIFPSTTPQPSLLHTIVHRSGTLVFDPDIDGKISPESDRRSAWIDSVIPGGIRGKGLPR